MKSIEEDTEHMDLLEKMVELENKQKQRLWDISVQREKDLERDNVTKLYEGTQNPTTSSILDQEEAHAKDLVAAMVSTKTTSNGPIVKVLSNVQGKYFLT